MNIKKLFPEKKESRKGLLEFLDKKGFYIVLVLCIAIVGATAVFVTTHNINSPNTDYNAEKIVPEEAGKASSINNNTDKAAMQPSVNTSANAANQKTAVGKPEDNSKAAAQNGNAKPAAQKEPQKVAKATAPTANASGSKAASQAKAQKFAMPVFGDVSFEYAKDKLVYSKTLEEWRTHSGIDLASERGTLVKAVADGVVTDIKSDPRFGITILIDHQNGIKTVYANLAGDDMVSPNQKVKQGDVIGCVGNTANFESAEQAHLHFEVLKKDEPVNPLDYLPVPKKN